MSDAETIQIPTGLCYSCRHLAEGQRHCHGTGDMEPDGYFRGLRCSCDCRDETS